MSNVDQSCPDVAGRDMPRRTEPVASGLVTLGYAVHIHTSDRRIEVSERIGAKLYRELELMYGSENFDLIPLGLVSDAT